MQVERRRVRNVHNWSQQSLEQLINSLGGIVWEADAQPFRITFVSEEVERLLGFSVEQWLNDPKLWEEHIHPDDVTRAPYLEAIVTSGQRRQVFEYRMIAADGRVVWLQEVITVLIENGVPTKMRGVMVDVTKRKGTEEAQRLSEERFRSLFEQSPIPVHTFSPGGQALQVNQAYLDMLGLSREEASTYNILKDEVHVRLGTMPYIRKAFEGEATELPLTRFGPQVGFGHERWIKLFAYPVKDESEAVREVVFVGEDVTERKEAEDKLREREEQYRGIFEATTDGLVIGTMEGITVEANPAFAAMHGYTREELMGMDPRQYIHPDHHVTFEEFNRAVSSGKAYKNQAIDLRKDGTTFPVEVIGTTFLYQGKPHMLGVLRDITERVHAEELARAQEEQYRAIFEATTDGLSINDLDGNLVAVNPAFAAMHGYSVEEMKGMDPLTFIHPDDHPHVPFAFAAFRAGKEYQETLGRDVRKDGSVFPIELHGSRFMYKGEPHILCIVRDITERVEGDERLKLKEAQYRSVFEATTDGLAIAELTTGTIVEVNPAFARMHGYTREEMVGMHPSVFVHPDDYEVQAEFIEKARAGKRAYAEGQDVRKDGTTFRIEVHAAPFMYNNQPHVLAIMRDITERVQAEEQLRLKEEQYRAIFEATSDGLVISDLDGNVLEVNPAFAAMEGYSREELVGMDPRRWIHPDSHANLVEYLERVRAGERFHIEGMQVRKDGTVFPAEVHEAPFLYNGQHHTLAIIRDITERVQARELLEQRVEERTRELSTLLEVSKNVTSTLELKPLLGRILEQLKLVADYNRARITVGGQDEISVSSAWVGGEEGTQLASTMEEPIAVEQLGKIGETLASGEPVILADIWDSSEAARTMREAILGEPESANGARERLAARLDGERSLLMVPLLLKDNIVGGLILRHKEPGYYTERHAELAMAIANQAAIAIENARLLAESRDKARLEERQRLARELHDSVTQALFSISLIARSAEVIIQREGTHSEQVLEKMTDLRQLTQGALAEMRALIFELRPGALEEAGLLEALRKHAAAVEAREMLPVAVLCHPATGLPRLKPAAEEALYRIAQEALHNVVKHARATRAEVYIDASDEEIKLRVSDDGVGFDMASVPAGHMGLGTMGERARALGGEYRAVSQPGEGTTITISAPLEEWRLSR